MLLVNPHNPLGQCYDREALVAYMQFAQKHKIHLIMDEVYALSVYDTSPSTASAATPFTSALGLGCLWSQNEAVLRALAGLSLYNWPSNVSEAIAVTILEDQSWIETFINTSRRRLGERSAFARSVLDSYGISYFGGANAGFFLWLDIRPFIAESVGKMADEVSWEDEQAFAARMRAHGVYLTPGEPLSSEHPGFVRLCYAKDEAEVRKGLARFHEALLEKLPST
jgi:1-aminocyclopropane-1-carboxylate synthase